MFLLTYTYTNDEGMFDRSYSWYETEEEMLKDIEFMKSCIEDLEIETSIEIYNSREINI